MKPPYRNDFGSELGRESREVKNDVGPYDDLSDPMAEDASPPKRGRFSSLYESVASFFIVRKIENFFEWVGGGVLAARNHVERLFAGSGRRSEATADVRNFLSKTPGADIKKTGVSDAARSLSSEKSHLATDENGSEINTEESNPEHVYSHRSSLAHAHGEADERAFKWWVNEYNKNGERAFCQNNFEPGAKVVAQQVYDSEVRRCNEFANKPDSFWRSAESGERLAAAAALLKKAIPMPDGMNIQVKVPTYSPEQKASFIAFNAWKSGGMSPIDREIDLKSALDYAEDFVKAHNTLPDALNKDTKASLDLAFDLINGYNSYLLKLTAQTGAQASRNLLASVKATQNEDLARSTLAPVEPRNAEPPPPPPPRRRDLSPPPPPPPRRVNAQVSAPRDTIRATAADVTEFPSEIKSLDLLFLRDSFSPGELRQIIRSTRAYFRAVAHSEAIDAIHRAGAMTLAGLWKMAKEDKEKIATMKNLPDFEILDQLLQVEKIRDDVR